MEKKNNITKWFVLFIAVLIAGFVGSTYFAADRSKAIEHKYEQEMAIITQRYEQEIKAIRSEKDSIINELNAIAAKRKFTIDQLKDKPNETKQKVRTVIARYHPDEYDSLITELFADLSRFD